MDEHVSNYCTCVYVLRLINSLPMSMTSQGRQKACPAKIHRTQNYHSYSILFFKYKYTTQ